jgi:hypothetical protein
MKPGHLNVFDGLRITTEHMNYLQGSFHSALQDLRGILGLGSVHEGFNVTAEGNAVTVGPGLAFDHQKNRIVLDTPATVELNFAPGENTKYVCVKYDQIEDGEVEGHFTLVWDSCAVVLAPALPEAADNLVAIARVDRAGNNGSFEVAKISSEPSVNSVAQPVRTLVRQGILRLSNTAAEASVDLGFEPLSLTCDTILNTKAEQNTFSSTAHGEATFASDGVSQFGVAGSKLIEDAIACLSYAGPGSPELLIKTNKKDANGFSMTAEEIKKIEDQGDVFEWEALVAWKALGESRG